jgi:hypothetical protein
MGQALHHGSGLQPEDGSGVVGQAKKAKAEDVRAYNAGFDIAGLVARAVTGFMEGGVVGLAENVMGQVVHAGLLPGVDKTLMSIPRTVVRMVDGLVHG